MTAASSPPTCRKCANHRSPGLVAAGAGLSIAPKSAYGMQRTDVTYLPLDGRGVTSPIVMAIRMLDDSQDLRNLLQLIYTIYDDEGIAYVRETL